MAVDPCRTVSICLDGVPDGKFSDMIFVDLNIYDKAEASMDMLTPQAKNSHPLPRQRYRRNLAEKAT